MRTERRCGELLLRHVRLGNSRSHMRRIKRSGPPRGGHVRLKNGVLSECGLSARLSTAYQALARIDAQTFKAELARRRDHNVPATRSALSKLIDGLSRPRKTKKTTDTAKLLRNALDRLRRVRSIVTSEESQLACEVAKLGSRWSQQVFRPKQDGPSMALRSLLCGRAQPAWRCGTCSGWFTEEPVIRD